VLACWLGWSRQQGVKRDAPFLATCNELYIIAELATNKYAYAAGEVGHQAAALRGEAEDVCRLVYLPPPPLMAKRYSTHARL